MKQLIYLSTSVSLMTNDELAEILEVSRLNNAELNITGILLYSDGMFIQALEGAAIHVDSTFEKIRRDSRHKNIITLIDLPATTRDFPDWSMGFTMINPEKYNKLDGYIKNLKTASQDRNSSAAAAAFKNLIKADNLFVR